MVIKILAFVGGFILGCTGYREALKTEIKVCKTSEDVLKILERMKIIELRKEEK